MLYFFEAQNNTNPLPNPFSLPSRHLGCLPFSQKIQKFRFKVKWKGNFPENPFGNCGLPPEVVLFFRSEWNVGNFLTICFNFRFPGPFKDLRAVLVLISSGWSAYSENPLPLCNGHTNRIFLTNGKHPSCPSYANLIPIYIPFFPILTIPILSKLPPKPNLIPVPQNSFSILVILQDNVPRLEMAATKVFGSQKFTSLTAAFFPDRTL